MQQDSVITRELYSIVCCCVPIRSCKGTYRKAVLMIMSCSEHLVSVGELASRRHVVTGAPRSD